MPSRRVVLAVLIALGTAPDTVLHSAPPTETPDWTITVTPQPFDEAQVGPFTVTGRWVLTGNDWRFGGLSALVPLGEHAFLAASDTGMMARFAVDPVRPTEGLLMQPGGDEARTKFGADIEALARDPASGTLWAAYEWGGRVERFGPDLQPEASIVPPQMADWSGNTGPESFARLPGGRFLAIEEVPRVLHDTRHRTVLFDGDPIEQPRGRDVLIEEIGDYRLVDAAALDDETVLLLLRRFGFRPWPTFDTAIAAVRIDALSTQDVVTPFVLAEFGEAIFRENYEGIAVTQSNAGPVVWLISDDNFASLQSTILLRLEYESGPER